MSEEIAAITLTDAERARIAELATPEEFKEWQRKALAEFIERQAELRAQEQARVIISDAVAQAKEDFPSVFAPVEEVAAEPVVEEPTIPIEEPQEQT